MLAKVSIFLPGNLFSNLSFQFADSVFFHRKVNKTKFNRTEAMGNGEEWKSKPKSVYAKSPPITIPFGSPRILAAGRKEETNLGKEDLISSEQVANEV